MVCCSTVGRMNMAAETLPLWPWCEASCTTGEENCDTPMSLDSSGLSDGLKQDTFNELALTVVVLTQL